MQISKPPFVNLCRSKFSAVAELTVTGLGIVSLSRGKAALQRAGFVPGTATFPSSLSFCEHHWEKNWFYSALSQFFPQISSSRDDLGVLNV